MKQKDPEQNIEILNLSKEEIVLKGNKVDRKLSGFTYG